MRGISVLVVAILSSIVMLLYSLNLGLSIGADWFAKDAHFQWHMNNYIVIDAKYAYSIFGLSALALGGLAAGLAMATFWIKRKTVRHTAVLLVPFLGAIILSGLGFNTLNFMLGSFYWTNMQYPPPVEIFFGYVDVWNFYFFLFVVPLWAGGFLAGLAVSYFVCIFPRRQKAEYASALGNSNTPSCPEGQYLAEFQTKARVCTFRIRLDETANSSRLS